MWNKIVKAGNRDLSDGGVKKGEFWEFERFFWEFERFCFKVLEKKVNKKVIFWKKIEKMRFSDVFKELDPHTRGKKIFVYPFCIASHPQMATKIFKKPVLGAKIPEKILEK